MRKFKYVFAAASSLVLLGACGTEETAVEEPQTEVADPGESPREAASQQVEMYNSSADSVGTAIIQEEEDGVSIHLQLEGLPAGEYGMHIHENGAATPPSFEDAGGHYNPTGADHGFEAEDGPHLGDLPNLIIPENGVVDTTVEAPGVSLDPTAEYSLASDTGTALIIHEEADDYVSQPTGDAGGRMAGGVILPGAEDN